MWVLSVLLRKNARLKVRSWKASLLELMLPLLFVVLFALLKTITDVVPVSPGWSLDGTTGCPYETVSLKTCRYPYPRFTKETFSYDLISRTFRGLSSGHETAKLFLATSSGSTRERDALGQFVEWMRTEGTAEGPVSDMDDQVFVLGTGTKQEIQEYAASESYGNPFTEELPEVGMAIVFDSIDFATMQFDYTLMLNSTQSSLLFETQDTAGPKTANTRRSIRWFNSSPNPDFIRQGWVTIARAIDSWIISTVGNASQTGFEGDVFQPYTGKWVPFPVSEYTYDEFFAFTLDTQVFPLVFTLCYLYPVARILEGLVKEKETRTTEMLKMMGVPEWKIIASWYITYAVFFAVLAFIIAAFSRLMLPATSEMGGGFSLLVFFIFFIFGMSVVSFCYALSTLFWRARTASLVGVCIYFLGFFAFFSVQSADVDPKPFLILLIPQVPFALAMQAIANLEATATGASIFTIDEPVNAFTLSQSFSMLIFDIFFWTGLGGYLSAVLPREYGRRQPFYFPVSPWYWRAVAKHWLGGSLGSLGFLGAGSSSPLSSSVTVGADVGGTEELTDLSDLADTRDDVEPADPAKLAKLRHGTGIRIRGLTKRFDTPAGVKVAVNNLDLDMFEGEILCLLGHNAAGKSTTLNILAGMLPASAGDAVINGASINGDMAKIRSSLGFCPQHDVLYTELTVQEHLTFYGRLKGLSGEALKDAIADSVARVALTEKTNVRAGRLSGGMKRKLSVAIALIGDSKVVFVDEPTSGVDPWSRRAIWEALQNSREGRVIVLTTHFMDEADLLGDRIAIMAEGRLKTLGSSLFLKNRFGAGYLMTMVKKREDTDVGPVERVVSKHVPAAKRISNVGTEVSFQLPTAAAGKFSALFAELDDSLAALDIEQYGISVTTLEEVFLAVARADDQVDDQGGAFAGNGNGNGNGNGDDGDDDDDFTSTGTRTRTGRDADVARKSAELGKKSMVALNHTDDVESGGHGHGSVPVAKAAPSMYGGATELSSLARFSLHFRAMFAKRVQYSRRDRRAFCCSILAPVALFALGLLILKLAPIGEDQPLYELGVDDWNPTFPAGERSGLPIIEFDEAGNDVVRLASQANFDAPGFRVENANVSLYGQGVEVDILGHTYVDGTPASCLGVSCLLNPPPLHGEAVLNLAEDMLGGPADRGGASLYAAAVVQPMEVLLPYSCLLGVLSVDISTGIGLTYEQEVCTQEGSPCALVETVFEGTRVCVPVGCFTNIIDNDAVDQILEIARAGSGGQTGLTPAEEQAALDEIVANTLLLTCDGENCNNGPSLLFEQPNVCRGDAASTCIDDGLRGYVLEAENLTIVEATQGDNINYCSGAAPALGETFDGASGTPPVGVDPLADRACQVSGIPALLTKALEDALLENGLAAGDFAVGTSVNGTECADLVTPCTMALVDTPNATLCVFDSCTADRDAALADLEVLVAGSTDLINNASRASCADVALLCNATLDLETAADLSAFPVGGLASVLNDTLVGLVNGTADFGDILADALAAGGFDVNATGNLTGINVTELFENFDIGNLPAAGSNATAQDFAAAFLLELVVSGTLDSFTDAANSTGAGVDIGDVDIDAITGVLLSDPRFTEALTGVLATLASAENTVSNCTDVEDQCLMATVTIIGGSLCVPVGCKGDFDPADFGFVTALGAATSFDDVPLFTCNTTQCNYGCRAGDQCDAEDLDPVVFETATATFTREGVLAFCPPLPVRYGLTALINSTANFGVPILYNALSTALLRLKMSEQEPGEFAALAEAPKITIRSHPLPVTATIRNIIQGFTAFFAAIFALIAFAFIPASVASYVVQEREAAHNVKHQQMVAGAGLLPYWLSLFAFDMLMYMVPFVSALALIVLFDISTFIENGVFEALVLVLFGYGLAVIPFAYLTSFLFKQHTSALIITLFINLLTGLVLMIASFVMDNLDRQSINDLNKDLIFIYRIFPGFCLGDSLVKVAIIKVTAALLGPNTVLTSPLDWDVAGANTFYLYCEFVVFSVLVVIVETVRSYPAIRNKVVCLRDASVADEAFDEDSDVADERERIQDSSARDDDADLVRVEGLRKVYTHGSKLLPWKQSANKLAVRSVFLGIPQGECFGLLGANGAGKTTLLKQITGDIFPSEGTAHLGGFDISTQPTGVRQQMGYCPQFDALLDLLTVREHLELFGKIKGLSGDELKRSVKELMVKLTLAPFANKLAKSLSGGTKRKLSVAISIIGAPKVLMMDEPSSGMDVVSKRFMWNVIESLRSGALNGQRTTVILTTHSMEEAEALCSRIGIMVGGRFRCLGSAQHLKNKFGGGLFVEVKLRLPQLDDAEHLRAAHPDLPDQLTEADIANGALDVLGDPERAQLIVDKDDAAWALLHQLEVDGSIAATSLLAWWVAEDDFQAIDDAMKDNFTGVKLTERHDQLVRYNVPSKRLAKVFDFLEGNKDALHLQAYQVQQFSLEEVFNVFAAQQELETGVARGVVKRDSLIGKIDVLDE